jgi:hypothetical protein
MRRGGSLVIWALFLATVVLPLMLVAIEGVRLLYVRGELQKAADAAAEAAAQRLDVPRFERLGEISFLPDAAAEAWTIASINASYLFQRGVYVQPEGIYVDGRKVLVRLRASVRPLLPALSRFPLVVRAQGEAELRVRRQ